MELVIAQIMQDQAGAAATRCLVVLVKVRFKATSSLFNYYLDVKWIIFSPRLFICFVFMIHERMDNRSFQHDN